MIYSFIVFLMLFIGIGLLSSAYSKKTKSDYYLASGNIPAWLVGLSAVATNNSGYMFIGVIGYTYSTGFAAIWLMLGWIAGDFLSSLFIHKRLRVATGKNGEVSYAGTLGNWYGQNHVRTQRLIGLISLLFLLTYAAAQLVAGSKALNVLLGWPLWSGAVLGAVMVSAYCFAGGIRASIWTDAAQSMVMIVAMATLLLVGISHFGGPQAALTQMQLIEGYTRWLPQDLIVPGIPGGALFIIGWMFAGFSVIGQPHIMVRFMTLNDSQRMRQAKLWYYGWFIAFYCMATGVGLLSRIFLTDTGSFDAELALPTMALELMPPIFVGLILAGIFSATMSTADSLVLSCSASITHDLLPHQIEQTHVLKLTTVAITCIALIIALSDNHSVFSLVLMAWSGLASAFAPLLIFLSLGRKPTETSSLCAIIIGFSVALGWRQTGLHHWVFEGLPGILSGLITLQVSIWLNRRTISDSAT